MRITSDYRNFKENYIIRHAEKKEEMVIVSSERSAELELVELSESQKREIDDFYIENYGRKIPYTWHQYYTSFTGNFDVCYFPERMYIPRFERYVNSPSYANVFGNKNLLPTFANAAGVNCAETILISSDNVFCDEKYNVLTEAEAIEYLSDRGPLYIKKSVGSSGGVACFKVNFQNGFDTETGKSIKDFFSCLGENFIAQREIEQHPLLSAFESGSAATFRVITYIWNSRIYSCPLTLRIGRAGTCVANAAIIIAVDDDGLVHPDGYSKRGNKYFEHPDSHVKFENYRIPDTPKLVDAAKRMHAMVPQVGIIHWDFTIDENEEPVVIEANTSIGSIWLPEIVHGKGPFGENTADILRWMRFMENVKIDDRYKYHPGYTTL